MDSHNIELSSTDADVTAYCVDMVLFQCSNEGGHPQNCYLEAKVHTMHISQRAAQWVDSSNIDTPKYFDLSGQRAYFCSRLKNGFDRGAKIADIVDRSGSLGPSLHCPFF
eukprot:scaffold187_cov266-Chaetoceros_neogracile.AAC.46